MGSSSEDIFFKFRDTLTTPVTRGFSITPDDDNNLSQVTRAIYVGGAGNLVVVLDDDEVGSPVTLVNVPAGTWLTMRIKRVMEATAATNLVGFA